MPSAKNAETTRSQQTMRSAIELMAKHHVEPTPHNYAVWYHYALGQQTELVQEVDQHIAANIPFTPAYNASLYTGFVSDGNERKALQDATANVQRHLLDVLKLTASLSGETDTFNQQLEQHAKHLSGHESDASLEIIIEDIVAQTAALRNIGSHMKERLHSTQQEMSTLKANLARITQESQRDFLTGVANRKAFDKDLAEHVETAEREHSPLTLLMIDIDHFKRFNDRFGHQLGDEVLKIIARSLTDCVKGKDMVARYGGEEFAVILPGTPPKGGVAVAEAIRSYVAKHDIKRRDSGEHIGPLSVSIGVATMLRKEDPASLIGRADEALYAAKHAGRNRVNMAE